MSETVTLALAWAAGGGLGALYFGGLWWTVRRGVSSRRPALLFSTSLLLRTGLVLAGFHLVGGGRAGRLLLCLLGFVLASLAATRLKGRPARGGLRPAGEGGHAPHA